MVATKFTDRFTVEQWPIANIRIGERVRNKVPDPDRLGGSLQWFGQLVPVAVYPDGTLIDGFCRLECMKKNGDESAYVAIIFNLDDAQDYWTLQSEFNDCRWGFTNKEKIEIARRRTEKLREEAKRRQVELGRSHGDIPPSDNLSEGGCNGRARELLAKEIGTGQVTAGKVIDIADAIEADPDNADLADIAEEKSIDAAHKELTKRGVKKKKKPVKPARLKVVDGLDREVPDQLRDIFADTQLGGLINELTFWRDPPHFNAWERKARELYDHNNFLLVSKLREHLQNARESIQYAIDALTCGKPFAVCPTCDGKAGKCTDCRNHGWLPEWRYLEVKG